MGVIEEMIKEADESNFRCVYCSAVSCNCDSEAGEPDAF